MSVIEIKHLTKDFGFGRGVFDINLKVEKGEVYGFLGPNGAGKSTTIRHIMGFTKPGEGTIKVNGQDAWSDSAQIQKSLGYLPGEIAFPENLTGTQFIKMMAELRGMSDMTHTDYLIEKFQLEPSGSLKRMSLGMKRKLAVVTAFMHNPEILILDEPTSGLDPIMQQVFTDFIKEEKNKGKTILLSSHIFSEIDATCDKISMIREGKLISSFVANDLKHKDEKTYKIELENHEIYDLYMNNLPQNLGVTRTRPEQNQVFVHFKDSDTNQFIKYTSEYPINFCSELKFTLEDYFMSFYEEEGK
ncbi:ABC transporter ATP-binding protein [Lactococcus lactis]|uniref:ABC transporter ATP-binding protein n=1 Tax=Lactococcus lactis TaxID=1358 RepID=A0A9X4NLS5_9LACT|nr:ABC transporter ATP-binding protein [Lactococcus lactis]MDG4984798.1 ABC transporter ATP-binding protein [Lactococcus lactis]